jgi:hypothetical protein
MPEFDPKKFVQDHAETTTAEADTFDPVAFVKEAEPATPPVSPPLRDYTGLEGPAYDPLPPLKDMTGLDTNTPGLLGWTPDPSERIYSPDTGVELDPQTAGGAREFNRRLQAFTRSMDPINIQDEAAGVVDAAEAAVTQAGEPHYFQQILDAYRTGKTGEQQRMAELKKQYPNIVSTGQLAGATAVGAAKGLQTLARVAGAGGTAASAAEAGYTEKPLEQAVPDVIKAFGVGTAPVGVVKGLGMIRTAALRKNLPKTQAKAEKKALQVLDLPEAEAIRLQQNRDLAKMGKDHGLTTSELAKDFLDNVMVTGRETAEEMLYKVRQMKESAKDTLTRIRQNEPALKTRKEVRDQLLQRGEDVGIKKSSNKIYKAYQSVADDILGPSREWQKQIKQLERQRLGVEKRLHRAHDPATVARLQAEEQALLDQINNLNKKTADYLNQPLSVSEVTEIRSTQDALAKVGPGKKSPAIDAVNDMRRFEDELTSAAHKKAKRQYEMSAIQEATLAKQSAKGIKAPKAMPEGAGIITRAVAIGKKAIPEYLGIKFFKRYSTQFRALNLNNKAKIIANPAWRSRFERMAADQGPTGVASAHHILMVEDPEYAKQYEADVQAAKE